LSHPARVFNRMFIDGAIVFDAKPTRPREMLQVAARSVVPGNRTSL
jgi:hypothetical protein